ncbi:hypothetical protein BCR42DRAFT_450997 [Absidia repens]|uniref:Actin cytoskeleton-regulatory complex protein SLA1 n=1 Tax=Absidia repens TaxID=90262 RepID=A0A1X2IIN4_9FUNG|nr:hypothetical protein BCR42DRAFT_450997 [Absidia repens]
MKYLQVCQALYDYQARTPDEININESDILYIIDKEDDDWWKAEIKQVSSGNTGPIGLVPATYLEEVIPIGKLRAEYYYVAQQEEEISFGEGQDLWLLERDDPDWYLVKLDNGDIGLAPSNYVQIIDATTDQQQQQQQQQQRQQSEPASASPNVVPTPINTTPPVSATQSIQQQTGRKEISDEAQSWIVCEYDAAKKKKRKGKGNLLVGNAMLCYGSETDKTSPVQQYPILDVSKYLYNSKTLHIEIDGSNPAVLDLQASSKSEAKAIVVKITDSRKTAQLAATHISQQTTVPPVNNIANSTTNGTKRTITRESRWASSLYAFEAEGGEEISVGENEQILVTDYDRDDGWCRVETVDGKSGILPSSYVQFYDDDGNQNEMPGTAAENGGVDSATSDEVEAYMRRQQELQDAMQLQDQRSSARRETQSKEIQKRKVDQQTRDKQERERRRRVQEAAQFAEMTRQRQMEDERILRETAPRSSSISPHASSSLPRSTSARQNLPKPDPDRLRTWTDRSGSFRVEAQFLAYTDGKLRLHKANGVKIDVPLVKMSAEDIRWVERRTDQPVGSITKKINEEKTPEMPPRPNPSTAAPDEQPRGGGSGSAKGKKPTNSNWDWFDWFMMIGIPMQEALVYSSAFKADNLDDSNLTQLTHKQMKMLGMKESHVQRMERYIDTENVEPPSDGEDDNNTRQDDVALQRQIETDEEMAKRLQKSWNEGRGKEASSSSSSSKAKYSVSAQKEMHPDLLDFLGSGSTPSNNEQAVKNASGGHSDLIGFSDDAWAPRPIKEVSPSQPQQSQHVPKLDQQPVSSPVDTAFQQSSVTASTYPQTTTPPSSSAQSIIPAASPQNSKSIDPTLLQWQNTSSSGGSTQLPNNQRPSLNDLSQQEQLRKHQQQQRQQSLLEQQQTIIMQQQQQIQQQQIQQQQIQLQQQQQNQNQLLQQTTGYQQPNGFGMQNNVSGAPQQQLPQITGYLQQHQITGYIPQQQQQPQQLQPLQPTGLSAAGQSMYQHQQQIPTQATGRNWNSSTPDNPFGSPSVYPQMTGATAASAAAPGSVLSFSTPNPNAFTSSPMQPTSSTAYLQQLQPQMTGIQQTELSGARDKYAAFRTPNADVFTQTGSMQHGQSGFSQNNQQYGQGW